MALFSKDIKSMEDLFVHTLQDIYYAEKKIEKALPKIIDKASNDELRKGFESHLEQTRDHVSRLEQVFRMQDIEPKAVPCPAIEGIIDEAEDVASEIADAEVLDAALAAAAQAVEHYEITRYGTLVTWAKQLGQDDCARLLNDTLGEEKETDEKLTRLAETRLNAKAA